MTLPMLAVETKNLTKDYAIGFWRKRPRRALDHLNLQVEMGEIFGLLGPNGAGKSTTLKLLFRLIFPTSGSARILGHELGDLAVHAHLGFLPENPSFYDHLSAREFLEYAAQLCGMDSTTTRRRAGELLERVKLAETGDLPIRKFSKGMVQRLGIAQALINDPELIFLDEPMSGLDPIGRYEMRDLILELRKQGKTIFFSTHILSDAEMLCDRVGILNRAKFCEWRFPPRRWWLRVLLQPRLKSSHPAPRASLAPEAEYDLSLEVSTTQIGCSNSRYRPEFELSLSIPSSLLWKIISWRKSVRSWSSQCRKRIAFRLGKIRLDCRLPIG